MPQTFINPYNPQTPIGASLQNIATMLFAGQGGRATAGQDVSGVNSARANLYRAQADEHAAKVRKMIDDAEQARQAADPQTIAAGFFGANRNLGGEVLSRLGGNDMGPPHPAVTPDKLANIGRVLQAMTVARGMPGNDNAAQIAKLLPVLMNEEFRQRAMPGGPAVPADSEKFGEATAASEGKPLVGANKFAVHSLFAKDRPVAPTPLGVLEAPNIQAQERQRSTAADVNVERVPLVRAQTNLANARTGAAGAEKAATKVKPGEYTLPDGSKINHPQLMAQYRLENNLIEPLDLRLLEKTDPTQAARERDKIANAMPFPQWAKENFKVDVRGGAAPAAPPAPATLPPEIASKLKAGINTTLSDQSVWTLENGKPKKVR